ncbi:hypothetical protein [Kaistella sp.]|uniref:hypothetical protein n=1 Tax=Kaistella sp. TaxID=2782235 RepID=UPI003C53222F
MVRKIVAIPAGLIAGVIGISLFQILGHKLYPLPAGMDPNDMNAMKEYVTSAPFMALFFVIISYAAGAFLSGFASTKVAGNNDKIFALVCGIIFLLQSIYMMYTLPTPIWFWILGIAVWGLVFVGYKLALSKK